MKKQIAPVYRRQSSIVVYTDYSGKSNQISYYAVKRFNGVESLHDYGFSSVSKGLKPTEGELKAALSALSRFPRAKVMTDCMFVIHKLASLEKVEHVKAHAGNVGNEHADYLARNSKLHPKYRNRK